MIHGPSNVKVNMKLGTLKKFWYYRKCIICKVMNTPEHLEDHLRDICVDCFPVMLVCYLYS